MSTKTLTKLDISPYSKIKVYRDDMPHNYSKEAKNKVRTYFAKKYGVNKNDINVVYRPVKKNDKGELVEITGAGIDNIMDISYQRALMKELLEREGKTVDFNRIIALDTKVNGELNVDTNTVEHKKWSIKWIMINNFLSFGEDNYVPFSSLKGLTVVNSVPVNQGGKTTLTIDAIKFLLHGNTTKTETNEQIFNSFSDKNELTVRGMIDIEGDEFIIERIMKRSPKKAGGWNITNKVNYYNILPDGEEKAQNEEDAKRTTIKLKEAIGSEDDFEMLVLATEKNLDDLIGLTAGESGKVLTRLIGLEILEKKETAVRKMYNEFNSKKKSNQFDVITLTSEIEEHNEKIVQGNQLEVQLKGKLEATKNDIIRLTNEKEKLLNSKEKVDVTISALNPSKLQEEIDTLTVKGKTLKTNVDDLKTKINDIGEVIFDEDGHLVLTNLLSKNNTDKAIKEAEITRLEKVIEDLIAGGICQSCNRKLDDVDNTEHINSHKNNITVLRDEVKVINEANINKIIPELEVLNGVKKLIDAKNKLELDKDRLEVEIGSLRNQVVAKMNDLKKYNLNLEAIELNRNIDIQVSKIKTDIEVAEHSKEQTITNIERVGNDLKNHHSNIDVKTKLIETIKKEEEVEKIFKIYIDLVGKKGISKLVLRSVLPIINSELQRLLEDVCDFEVEIFIDEKNDVKFLLIKSGVTKLLKSGSGFEKTAACIALRGILGKISSLPMPNFITFDEVLGRVGPENIEKLKSLFDKIKDMYEILFVITHNDLIKDWGDKVITVVKTNDISKISIK
jgi:DNA repair exonuclease SbcCD ATPase subunit